jgi:hypothetical protein
VYKALHRPLTIWGVDRRLFFLALLLGAATFNLFYSFLAGLLGLGGIADKIRAVQEAIAAAPKPVHVPRERKPIVVPDDGPLVLVETRKDLSQLKLPFELLAAQAQQQQQQQ